MLYKIFCLIPGGGAAFAVNIDETKTVDHSKDAIKAKKMHDFAAFDANKLTLYKIDVGGSNKEEYIKKVKHVAWLNPVHKLTKAFGGNVPLEATSHILVQPPKGESCTRAGLNGMLIPHSPNSPISLLHSVDNVTKRARLDSDISECDTNSFPWCSRSLNIAFSPFAVVDYTEITSDIS
jgi:hypothetical protein